MSNESKFRVTAAQTSALCKFFEDNPGLIRGYKKTVRNKRIVQKKWKKITDILNSCGPTRSQKSWSTYLSNIKAKLKGHSLVWRQSTDGSGPEVCNADKFNEIQLRMLKVLSKRPNPVETNIQVHQQEPSQNYYQALPIPSQTKSESICSDDDSDSEHDLIILDPYEQYDETEHPGSPEDIKSENNNGDSSRNYGNTENDSNIVPSVSRPNRMSRELKYRVTAAQTKILSAFFEANPEVVKGYKRTKKSKIRVQNKWKKISVKLNAYGPSRDPLSWSKYLSNIKAKLKGQKIKWSQSSNGTGPIICNADDFKEIQLRMLQVLSRRTNSEEAENSQSDSEIGDFNEDEINTDFDDGIYKNEGQDTEFENKFPDQVKPEQTTSSTKPAEIFVDDEFASFAKNVAQQLRNLPLPVALETQEKLLSVLRDQRIKFLIGSTRCLDPLDK
ncbi:uncharacterized protein LOC113496445 [Trichoplusia ni]|uniref:Uncharacterized protein LOC113496445 n=1 Tax=Trichoplusia ni TaxID=7111 RepID=A0A7E5VSZ8_TRINI|nr:uncharacterized protein LOC113496445 [Trichoplusia ni]